MTLSGWIQLFSQDTNKRVRSSGLCVYIILHKPVPSPLPSILSRLQYLWGEYLWQTGEGRSFSMSCPFKPVNNLGTQVCLFSDNFNEREFTNHKIHLYRCTNQSFLVYLESRVTITTNFRTFSSPQKETHTQWLLKKHPTIPMKCPTNLVFSILPVLSRSSACSENSKICRK